MSFAPPRIVVAITKCSLALSGIAGARYGLRIYGAVSGEEDYYLTLEVRGNTVTEYQVVTRATEPIARSKINVRTEVNGYKIDGRQLRSHPVPGWGGRISDDGESITTFTIDNSGRESNHEVYKRER